MPEMCQALFTKRRTLLTGSGASYDLRTTSRSVSTNPEARKATETLVGPDGFEPANYESQPPPSIGIYRCSSGRDSALHLQVRARLMEATGTFSGVQEA